MRVKARKNIEEIKKIIADKVEGAVVREAERKLQPIIFHVKDLDLEATIEEVKEGVKAVVGTDAEIKLSALRPAYGDAQNATIVVSGITARKLSLASRIQTGWMSCRLVRQEDEQRFFRCWENGHFSTYCKEEGRSRCCFKYGEESHKKAVCEAVAMWCGGTPHQQPEISTEVDDIGVEEVSCQVI